MYIKNVATLELQYEHLVAHIVTEFVSLLYGMVKDKTETLFDVNSFKAFVRLSD